MYICIIRDTIERVSIDISPLHSLSLSIYFPFLIELSIFYYREWEKFVAGEMTEIEDLGYKKRARPLLWQIGS